MGLLIDEVARHSIGWIDPPHVVTGYEVIDFIKRNLRSDPEVALLFRAPQRLPWTQTWLEFPFGGEVRGVLMLEVDGAEMRSMVKGGPLPNRFPPLARDWVTTCLRSIDRSGKPGMEGWDRAPIFHFTVAYTEERPEKAMAFGISARDIDGVVLSDGKSEHGDSNIYSMVMTQEQEVASYYMGVMSIAHMIVALFHVRGMEQRTRRQDDGTIRARMRRKRPVTVEYTTIGFPGVAFGSPQEEREHQGIIPAHLVRGHFADYTGGPGLFGRRRILVWKPAHVRGAAERGVVLSEHAAREPKFALHSGVR